MLMLVLLLKFSTHWHTSVEIEYLRTPDRLYIEKKIIIMLNGKFYTGLTPKMLNRNNSTVTNRLESHFFWPDDTDTETVEETRVRRRASLSLTPANKPLIQKRNQQNNDTSDEVDTKQMLHNQFSKSSIQFFDNIYEEEEPQQRNSKRAAKKEITCKPTATKMVVPPNFDADMAAIKNKHMFESKLEFNDFIGEDLNNRNNLRKNKIDMNDKVEMERNSKNSPKLQNKKNVQNLIEIETREKTPTNRWRAESEFRENTKYNSEDEARELQRKSRGKSVEFRNRQNKYRRDQTPKRILKPAIRNGTDYSAYPECRDDDYEDEAFQHMQINGRRPILKKHVSYSEEEEEIPIRHYHNRYHDDDDDDDDDDYKRKDMNQSTFKNPHANRHRNTETKQDQDQHFVEKQNTNNNYNKCDTNNDVKNNNKNNNNQGLNIAQKHLRSSLCFHDGEIVASDSEATSSSSALTPRRRNARGSATNRVSVGLPD